MRIPAALVIAASLALAGPARADVYCAPKPCSDGTPADTIQQAIDAADAHGGPDVVSIKAGTWNAETSPAVGLQVSSSDTQVHGAGVGQTVLTAPARSASFGSGLVLISG